MDLLDPKFIRSALAEDRAANDITSEACVDWVPAMGKIILKESGSIAGLKFLPQIFSFHHPEIKCQPQVEEGAHCKKGTCLALVSGPSRALLSGERVALNFLQHLSGIATLTARCVKRAAGTSCKIFDTRKTLPGMRALQKYAVRMGGGVNHRMDLADRILIKNNHLAFGMSLSDMIAKARQKHPSGWIEIEISRSEDLPAAIEAKADAVLLDNMSVDEVSRCVKINRGRIFLEASGGIRWNNLKKYALAGVDGISMGALTHSAPALDICMRITRSNL